MAKKYLLILGISLVALISILLLLPNYSSAIIQISSSDSAWTVTKSTGTESRLTFWTLNGKDKKTELGWIPPDNSCIGWTDQYIYDETGNRIKDDKNKDIAVKCESAKCGGLNCYHISLTDAQAVNIDDFVRLGTGTIVVEYQEQKKVEYISDWFNLSATLYIELNGDWNNTINNIFVYDKPDKKKFGANVTGFNETRKFKYIIESTSPIQDSAYTYTYLISNGSESHAINLKDVCQWKSKADYDGIVTEWFTPNCTFKLEENILEIEFLAEYNSTLETISIDPEMYIIPPTAVSGEVIYRDSGNKTPRSQLWDGNAKTFGGETSIVSLGGLVLYPEIRESKIRNETILVIQTANQNIAYSVKNNSNGTWTSFVNLSNTATATYGQVFDVEYEDLTQRAIIVYDNATLADNVIKYRIWDGQTMGAEQILTTPAVQNYTQFVQLAARNNSNEMILAVSTYGGKVRNLTLSFWNGSDWLNTTNIDSGNGADERMMDVAFEGISGRPIIMVENSTTQVNVWSRNSTTGAFYWITNLTGSTTNGGNGLVLCADPNSDYIGEIDGDNGADIRTSIWNGTENNFVHENRPAADTSTENLNYDVNFGCKFGANGTALFAFNSVSNAPTINWLVWTRQTNNWTCPQNDRQIATLGADIVNCTVAATDDVCGMRIYSSPNSDEMIMITADIVSDTIAFYYNSTNFTTTKRVVLETENGFTDYKRPFDFAYNVFPNPPVPDYSFPIFREYYDNNATLTGSGIALFNVTINNTNGTVYFEIGGANYTPSYLDTTCYQEFANVSTACGGYDSGYYETGFTSAVYDGDYTTSNNGGSKSMYVEYKKPIGSTGESILQSKDSVELRNSSLASCWDYNSTHIRLNVSLNSAQTQANWSCYDGTVWRQIFTNTFSPMYIFEEAIIWKFQKPNIYNVSVTLNSGTYSYYWGAYGNGTKNNQNTSGLRNYVVNTTITDNAYPIFLNYWDNNATLTDSGTASFNVTIEKTNGTAFLEIDGVNYTASNRTVYNQTWLYFNESSYVSINNKDWISPNKTNEYTVSTWINVPFFNFNGSGSSALKRIIAKGATNNYEFAMNVYNSSSTTGNNVTSFQIFGSTGSSLCLATSNRNLIPNTWNYITGTFNGSNCYIYNNGIQIAAGAKAAAQNITNGTATLRIGSMAASGTAENFIGSMDSMKIWNKSLSPLQIRRLFNESSIGSNLGKGIPVLSYHNIDNSITEETIVNLSNFDLEMKWLYQAGYKTITYDTWLLWKNGYISIPEKSIIIVFDDAKKNVITNATTIMDSYGFIGVVGVISTYVSTNNYMNWSDITILKNKGWQIGSHGATHCDFIGSCNTTANWTNEFNNSRKDIIGNISITPTLFIYPFNSNNDTSDNLCAQYYTFCSGYSAGTSTYESLLFKNANLTNENGNPFGIGLRRIIISNTTTITDFSNAVDYYSNIIIDLGIDENDGNITYDVSGYNNNGTLTGSAWRNDNVTINLFNVSLTLDAGTYNYYWGAYGNGTKNNQNTSGLRNYVVNAAGEQEDSFFVNVTQGSSLTSGTGDKGTYTRQQKQGLSVNSTERNKGIFNRIINTFENIGSYLTRKIASARSLIVSASINSASAIRGVYNRLSQMAIALSLRLTSPSQAAITSYVSNVYQSISYNFYHTDRYTGRRIIFNSITINTNSDGVYNGRRQVLIDTSISAGADGVYSGRRMVTATATIGDKIVKLISKNKNFYEVVTINTKNKFVSKITRTVLLPINIIASLRIVGTSVSDIVPPVLNVYSPTAKTYTTSIINLSVSATDDTAVNKYWFTMDGGKTNTTFTPNITLPNINFSVDATYSYILSVFVNDTAGNIDYETILFYTGIDETNALYFIFYVAIIGTAFFFLVLSYRDNNYIFGILAGMLISAVGIGLITLGYPGLSEGMVKTSLYLIFIGVGLVILIYNSIKALGGDD